MEIVESPDQIILRDMPAYFWSVDVAAGIGGILLIAWGISGWFELQQILIGGVFGLVLVLTSLFKLRRRYGIINIFTPAQVEIEHQPLFGKTLKIAQYSLPEIEDVLMNDATGEDESKVYYLFLRLTSGKNIPLLAKFVRSEKMAHQATDAIHNFLTSHRKAE